MRFSEAFKVGGSFIYGRDDDMNRIIELLPLEDGNNLNSTVVSIVADRGTGRTTLLHLLHSELGNAFDTIKFASMPEKYDEKGLMKVIIESLTEIPCDITDLEVLKETLEEELKDNRFLLLLDDFENNSQNCWDLLIALLFVCKDKSAIVVTTTGEAVAKVKGPVQFYYMNNLSDESCWAVFKQGVFPGEDLKPDIVDTGKLLISKCNNITLCIKVLSGLLRHYISDDLWRAVLESNFWEMDEVDGKMQPALRVCYEYLPLHLKKCFKYCSLFPKEYIFSKEHLVRLWLSQGFIEPADGRELEDIGAEYFDYFLSLSFFQPSFFPGQNEDMFLIPGLIHDLALLVSKNECFQFEGCVQRAPENACHLSVIPHEFQSVSLSHLIMRAQNLQTLLVVGRSAFHNQGISSSIVHLADLKDLIGIFHDLVTLDLNNSDIEELPDSFRSLTNLRYLSLRSTRIKRIPLEIANLIQLQTLEAKDCDYLEELPRSIEALTNLRYLDVTKEAGYVVMPHGIGNLTNLRNLATFNVGKDALVHCGIDELKDMQHLKGCLQISGLVNVRSGSDAIKADMRSKEYIETLCFNWSDWMSSLEGDEYAEIAEEVLENLHPTDILKEIIIRDYPGNNFPKWIECAAFTSLISIIFDHCYNCERLPALGALPSLKFLTIRQMYSVERMNLSGSDDILENIIRYPSLEQLSIWEMYGLMEWVELENGNFPVLHSLSINRCPFLRNIPKFPGLVKLSVYSCAQFVEKMELPSLQSLKIEGLQKTKSVRLSKNLVGLMKLEISHCPELLSIEGLPFLNSLETIAVFGCPQFYPVDIHTRKHGEKLCSPSNVLAEEQDEIRELEPEIFIVENEEIELETTSHQMAQTEQRAAILDPWPENPESVSPLISSFKKSGVPKFGNWEEQGNVAYTAYFENARINRKLGGRVIGGRVINPNVDLIENPEAFASRALPMWSGSGSGPSIANTSHNQKEREEKVRTSRDHGQRSEHLKSASQNRTSSTPTRSPRHPGGTMAKATGRDNNMLEGAVPKFWDWDIDPSSAEGYTDIFKKVREEKQTGSAKSPMITDDSINLQSSTHSRSYKSPGLSCFPWWKPKRGG